MPHVSLCLCACACECACACVGDSSCICVCRLSCLMSKYLHKQRTAPKSRQCLFLITCCVSSASCFFFFLCLFLLLFVCVFRACFCCGRHAVNLKKLNYLVCKMLHAKGKCQGRWSKTGRVELSSTTSFFIICKLLRCRCAPLCSALLCTAACVRVCVCV